MESAGDTAALAGPELTQLGKRIETLRIHRGISKQHLARFAGTSRQQLWRVMTGKSDLTGALRDRLAEALRVEVPDLLAYAAPGGAAPGRVAEPVRAALAAAAAASDDDPELRAYLGDVAAIERTLRAMPMGPGGRRLKRAYLDALEDASMDSGAPLDERVFALRRSVLSGEL